MNAEETYLELCDLELWWNIRKDNGEWSIRLNPKELITPELRAAVQEHKMQLICKTVCRDVLEEAAQQLDLEYDLEKMPPASEEIMEAYKNGDPDALVVALGDYINVWQVWSKLKAFLDKGDVSAALVSDWGVIMVEAKKEADEAG